MSKMIGNQMKWLYKIGDKVTITHISCFIYNNEREKVIQSKQLDQPIQVTICGAIHKRMGKINQGYSDGLEYYPPSLTISHTVPVYKVKKTIISKEDYVLPEHIVSDAHKKVWTTAVKEKDGKIFFQNCKCIEMELDFFNIFKWDKLIRIDVPSTNASFFYSLDQREIEAVWTGWSLRKQMEASYTYFEDQEERFRELDSGDSSNV